MMLSLHDRPADIDAFAFFLGTQLGKTLGEVEALPYSEYVQWAAFFTAKHAIENKRSVALS